MFPYCFHKFRWNPFTNRFKGQLLNFYRIPITAPIINPGWLRNNMISNITCYYSFLWFFVSALNESLFRSSRPEDSVTKFFLENFTKFTGKHLRQSGLEPATLLKERLWHRCFPANFVKFLRMPFLKTTLVSASGY